ncbi:hypothetical protein [Lentzea sp. E54]|uniref:hypothetical protein n=1 Tax=Lentzea xerophila TaxID=3435883 RepID=UPI003DA34480
MQDSELEKFLSSHGWEAAGFRRETDTIVAYLERVGFACHEEARKYLGEYLGLRIDHLPALVIAGERISSWTNLIRPQSAPPVMQTWLADAQRWLTSPYSRSAWTAFI